MQEVTKITGNKRNVKILDVAAGTGICGELVSLKILARNLMKNNGGLSKWINLNLFYLDLLTFNCQNIGSMFVTSN